MATAADAELILKLYDLRRDARMREARNWVVHEFQPADLQALLAVQRDFGSEHNQYWRQVISYWEMAAAFVLHGALEGELLFDSVGEIVYLVAKFGRLHEEFAAQMGGKPGDGFMPQSIELMERFPKAKARMVLLRTFLDSQKRG